MTAHATTSIWANRMLRSLAGQWGTSGDPTVMRSLGQLIPLDRPGRAMPSHDQEQKTAERTTRNC